MFNSSSGSDSTTSLGSLVLLSSSIFFLPTFTVTIHLQFYTSSYTIIVILHRSAAHVASCKSSCLLFMLFPLRRSVGVMGRRMTMADVWRRGWIEELCWMTLLVHARASSRVWRSAVLKDTRFTVLVYFLSVFLYWYGECSSCRLDRARS